MHQDWTRGFGQGVRRFRPSHAQSPEKEGRQRARRRQRNRSRTRSPPSSTIGIRLYQNAISPNLQSKLRLQHPSSRLWTGFRLARTLAAVGWIQGCRLLMVMIRLEHPPCPCMRLWTRRSPRHSTFMRSLQVQWGIWFRPKLSVASGAARGLASGHAHAFETGDLARPGLASAQVQDAHLALHGGP